MEHPMYPLPTKEISQRRKELAPDTFAAFQAFSKQVFADGTLPARTKELIAVAVAHVTQCPYCIRAHTKRATLRGVSPEEIMEAVWVAAEMRAGAASAHSSLAIDEMDQESIKRDREAPTPAS